MHTLIDSRRGFARAPTSRFASPLSAAGVWRRALALFTLLAFVLLVGASGSHVHVNSVAAHDCTLCSGAVDAVGDVPAPPALVLQLAATSYVLRDSEELTVVYLSPALLPPSCGPPCLSV